MSTAIFFKIIRSFAVLSIILFLMDCGGGGGGGSSTSADTSFKLFPDDFFDAGYQESYLLTGSDTAGYTWEGSISEQADGITTFNGEQALSHESILSVTNKQTQEIIISATITDYYSISSSDRRWLGQITLPANITTLPTSMNPFPQTAEIGDFGTVGSYYGSDGDTETITWQLKNANHGLAYYVMTSTYSDGSEEQTSYTIDQNGDRKAFSDRMYFSDSGVTVTLSGNRI